MLDGQLLPFLFVCLTSFFTLANPLGTMPVFLSMTRGLTNDERNRILRRSIVIATLTLLGFTFCGQFLFTLFGISANGFRIAAGFIIIKIGFDMLNAKYKTEHLEAEEQEAYANNITVTPLAIPLLCGPGGIANGIVLMEQAGSSFTMIGIVVGSIIAIYVLSYFILAIANKLVPFIGETGNNVMMRLMGLILMVIAVEMFVSGIKPIVIDILHQALA